ncbi:glycosyltransferase family 4 protein [Sphingomonas naphthae]|uniref:Glycosyltransferase family 4 protein n=1 Tax=Sphingomonas naphthae TaxID=1813468 RepID=A0ABY7TKQ2_9SPHN|nr:glycosyltransferase family 4 protein [Sphingomonas naphthae]WCT73618.1 glycosyltransferase family 4 protein [Sphingomonas naphthae]
MTSRPLLIFETHPIQYRAPIFQRLQQLRPDAFEVIYASDFSVRGYVDKDFGTALSWDMPLLSGYAYRVLNNEAPGGIARFGGLTARGIDRIVGEARPAAVMLSSLGYSFSFAAYFAALRRRIPVWYRADTNERAFARPAWKSALRAAYYRFVYSGLSRALYVGELNRDHFAKFGIGAKRLARVAHCTPNRLAPVTPAERATLRANTRAAIGAVEGDVVLGFFGKLIDKKNPALLLDAVARLGDAAAGLRCLFVGAGQLEAPLRAQAAEVASATGVASHFAGFVNQARIDAYYLATDILVLPSGKAGETWGLVVNEALQAGCAVIVTDEVGCAPDFADLPRFRVIPVGDADALAAAIADLRRLPRSLDWADAAMARYSVDAAAEALAGLIDAARK